MLYLFDIINNKIIKSIIIFNSHYRFQFWAKILIYTVLPDLEVSVMTRMLWEFEYLYHNSSMLILWHCCHICFDYCSNYSTNVVSSWSSDFLRHTPAGALHVYSEQTRGRWTVPRGSLVLKLVLLGRGGGWCVQCHETRKCFLNWQNLFDVEPSLGKALHLFLVNKWTNMIVHPLLVKGLQRY